MPGKASTQPHIKFFSIKLQVPTSTSQLITQKASAPICWHTDTASWPKWDLTGHFHGSWLGSREVGGIACLTSHSKLSPGSHWYDTFRMLPRPSRKDSKLSALLHIGSLWPESLHSSDYFLLSGESNHVTISTSLDRISLPPPPTLSVSLSLRPFLASPPAFPRPPPTGRGLSFP